MPDRLNERLQQAVALAGGGDAVSRLSGIPRRTLGNYLSGRNEPKAGAIAQLGQATGVTIEWLVTGEGPMLREERRQIGDAYKPVIGTAFTPTVGAAVAPAGGIDRDLLARVHKGVAEAYRAENARISADPLADEVARIYDDLVATYDSPDERLTGLKLMLHQLRRELRSPAAGGDTRKEVS